MTDERLKQQLEFVLESKKKKKPDPCKRAQIRLTMDMKF